MHQQTYRFQTDIHALWGTLLALFATFRLLTYFFHFLRPPTSVLPSRPPTEALAAMCVTGGGAVFILSTEQMTFAAMRHGFDNKMVSLRSLAGSKREAEIDCRRSSTSPSRSSRSGSPGLSPSSLSEVRSSPSFLCDSAHVLRRMGSSSQSSRAKGSLVEKGELRSLRSSPRIVYRLPVAHTLF